MIGSGFFDAIGGDVWLYLKTLVTDSNMEKPVEIKPAEIMSLVLSIAGIITLVFAYYMHTRTKNRGKESSEEKLNNVIQEIKQFIKKWNKGIPLLTTGYRKEILEGAIWLKRPEKILKHSIFIKRRIAQVKELKIKNSSIVLNNLTDISNEIAQLGNDVENTVLTQRLEYEALKKDPELFKKFVDTGDKICSDLKQIILELEKLRSHVL